MDDVQIDMLMFSVNPAYDYGKGEYAFGEVDERAEIYRRCEKEGVGITVMKPFSGGQLLDEKQSPFGKALTPYQCIRYRRDGRNIKRMVLGSLRAYIFRAVRRSLMMDNERSAFITLGGQEYELILTTLATKSIARRYGGLENLGDKLAGSEHFEEALDEIVWLITLLANQSIMIYNLWNEKKKPLLTEETVELLTSPYDLAEYKTAIMTAMYKGAKREIESEPSKNTTAG